MTTSPISACSGEGRKLRRCWTHERGCGFAHEDTEDCGPCAVCDGTGREEVDGEMITLEDLELIP